MIKQFHKAFWCYKSRIILVLLTYLRQPPWAVVRMWSNLLSHTDGTATLLLHATSNITMARRRWRMACVAIYSYRAFLSIIKSNIPKLDYHLQSPYTILEVEPCDPTPQNHIQSTHDQTILAEMVRERNLDRLHELGGVKCIAKTLKTDVETGIHAGEDQDTIWRKERYGSNTHTRPRSKSFFHFFWSAFNDPTLVILLVCAGLSLGFGIKEHGVKEGWYEGGSIFLAVFLVVVVSAISNYRQEKQFHKLSKISDDIKIDVMRDSRRQQISIFDVVVGDVVHLKIGDQVPADGLLISGYSMQLDESSMTGESDQVEVDTLNNPFLHSGSKVVEGYGHMLVTSVGKDTAWGEMMSSIAQDSNELTPLQVRLNALTSTIGKVGLTVAFLVLAVLLARYFTGKTKDEKGNKEYQGSKTNTNSILNSVVNIVAAAVTIVVVAIPEGLPLAVTLTLAYSMKRMMTDQAMVRKLSACETMGSATVICTDKTGTLTLNQMKVTKYWLGEEKSSGSFPERASDLKVIKLLQQGIGLNTTGSVYIPTSGAVPEITGSPTEKAILSWAVQDLRMDLNELKRTCTILHVESFNSEKKRSGVLVRDNSLNTIHMHWKGAAEIVLSLCSSYYAVGGEVKPMDEDTRSEFETTIESMAACSLRCIAFAHKHSPDGTEYDQNDQNLKLEEDFTLLAIAGLKDPCRPEVKKAVEICKDAGVDIKMITGDNVFTAKAIATECGILDFDEQTCNQVVEGVVFRNYTHEERLQKVDSIRVMARSSPMDKLLMVQCLKQKGHVVAVTGDGTNDAPALKEADIGLSMGIQGTEVAKESSDIVILDDNFNTVVTVLKWGRCVYNNIQKFIQFQLTVNVAALVINFVAAVSAGEVPLTAVQMLWVNLIMDTLGALALATERPTNSLLHNPPVGRKDPLITIIMWRNLLFQAAFQITILLILQFKGQSIFNVTKQVKDTLIFNIFVLCQVFNEFNSRKLQTLNIFEGIHRNPLFVGIVAATIVLQIMMVEFLKKFASTERLTVAQWGACLVIAAFTWPIGALVKLIPVK